MQNPSRPSVTIEEQVGDQIATLRQMRELTQRQLATLLTERGLPVDASAISRIEKGQRALRLSEALVLAEAFGVDLSFLVMGLETPDQAFRSARRYSNQLMNDLVGPASDWLNSIAYVAELARDDPSRLELLHPVGSAPTPKRAEQYLPWVLQNVRELTWHTQMEAFIDEDDDGRRSELRAIGHAFIDSLMRISGEVPERVPTAANDSPSPLASTGGDGVAGILQAEEQESDG